MAPDRRAALVRVSDWAVLALLACLPLSNALSNLWLGLACAAWLLSGPDLRRILRDPVSMAVLIFVAIALVSLRGAADLHGIRGGAVKLLKALGLYGLLFAAAQRPGLNRRMAWALMTGLLVACIDGLLQRWLGVDPIYRHPLGRPFGLIRVTGPYHHPTDLGLYLSAVVPLALALVWSATRARGGFGAAALLGVVLVGLTFSRGAMLALAMSAAIVMWRNRAWWLAIAGIGWALVFKALVPASMQAWAATQSWLAVWTQPDRLEMWAAAARIIRAHPWLGVGFNQYVAVYTQYNPDTMGRPYAHNLYLHVWAELGLVGLAAFGVLLVVMARRWLAALRPETDRLRRALLTGLGAGLAGFLVNGLFESSLAISRAAMLFWLLAGWLAGLTAQRRVEVSA